MLLLIYYQRISSVGAPHGKTNECDQGKMVERGAPNGHQYTFPGFQGQGNQVFGRNSGLF